MLHVERGPVLLVSGGDLQSIQAQARLNLDEFEGTLRLVHHVQDASNYDFLAISGGRVQQGRMEDGDARIFDERPFEGEGWVALRTVSDATRFRGYLNGELVTHGHGSQPDAGPVGLYFTGSGMVMLQSIQVESLR